MGIEQKVAVITGASQGIETYAQLAALHPVGRLGEISDIVDAILYLEGARFVTGEIRSTATRVRAADLQSALADGIDLVPKIGRPRQRRAPSPVCSSRTYVIFTNSRYGSR